MGDYNETQRSLRIRIADIGAADVASKTSDAKQPAKRQKLTSNRDPTKVLVLSNLVGAGDVDSDLEEETSEEAQKYGKLSKCTIRELKGVPDDDAVRIFLEYEAVDSAKKAFDVFNGRIFDGRTVKAWFYDEGVYRDGDLERA